MAQGPRTELFLHFKKVMLVGCLCFFFVFVCFLSLSSVLG